MTRILQIRRGTAAQNNNFTGLAGEITMDTTNKTIRVHDGETVGGIALARHDEITGEGGGGSEFDINSVSSDFWTALFATYQTNNVINSESSNLLSVSNVSFIDNTFQCASLPISTRVVLVCQTPEAGYSIGDETEAFGIGSYRRPLTNSYLSNNKLHVTLYVGGQRFWVAHKTDGDITNITNANWKLKISVYY